MKFLTLAILASAVTLGGCESINDQTKPGVASSERPYTPLGTLIAKKGGRSDAGSVDMQSLENDRAMNNGVNNSGK